MFKNVIFTIIVLALGLVWLRYFEWRSLFFPTREFSYTPETFGMEYEDVFIKTQDGPTINAWFVPAKDSRYTILFCHGNGGNISHRVGKIEIFNKLGLNMFIFDYRGYGKSEGGPSEQGIYLDVQAAYNYLVKEKGISEDSIVVYGESLGAAVAVDLASRAKLKAVILEGAFTSAKDMSSEIYPFLPTFILKSKLDSLSKIKSIPIAKLFIHSSNDEIVPIRLSRKLFDAAGEPKTFKTIGGGHNTCHIDSQKEYVQSIVSFIEQIADLQYNRVSKGGQYGEM
ncbi:alpha/beta hydrolase [Candidatus Omnitrophota bacterium]